MRRKFQHRLTFGSHYFINYGGFVLVFVRLLSPHKVVPSTLGHKMECFPHVTSSLTFPSLNLVLGHAIPYVSMGGIVNTKNEMSLVVRDV